MCLMFKVYTTVTFSTILIMKITKETFWHECHFSLTVVINENILCFNKTKAISDFNKLNNFEKFL